MPDLTSEESNKLTRRHLLRTAQVGGLALAGGIIAAPQGAAAEALADDFSDFDIPEPPYAFIDGTGHGWQEMGPDDFANVNCAEDTWQWRDGVLYCTGQPLGVLRTAKIYTNVEMCFEWCHRKKGGNSGLFVWSKKDVIERMTAEGKPGLPNGIEVQILDVGYNPEAQGTWFTVHGDVFPVHDTLDPFPPISPDGARSFPSENRTRPHNHWNHYYVRAINGEVRLWVNGKEVSGGNNASTRTGYLCLQSEGAPIEFRNIRLRELP